MKVYNITNSHGNKVANQFIVTDDQGNEYFQSYKSIIAKKDWTGPKVKVTLDTNYWDYSKTTSKYRNIFLGESRKETDKKILSGEYILADLNG